MRSACGLCASGTRGMGMPQIDPYNAVQPYVGWHARPEMLPREAALGIHTET